MVCPSKTPEWRKAYEERNRERIAENKRRWKMNNREKLRKAGLEYYYRNKHKTMARNLQWQRTHPESRRRTYSKRLAFAGKTVWLTYNPRTGQCSECHRRKGDGIKKTAMHHTIYVTILPWFGAIELCDSCHMRKHFISFT